MIVYLTKTPGDPWAMLQKAELERNRGNYDDAKLWAEKAGYFLSKHDQQEARNNLAETAFKSKWVYQQFQKQLMQWNEEQRHVSTIPR